MRLVPVDGAVRVLALHGVARSFAGQGELQHLFLGVVDLERGVGDAVVVLEEFLRVAADGVAVAARLDQDVRGEGGLAGGDLPDMPQF
ncbi:hypothetical protein GCM10023084_60290 [Streptomyces lacrimifluminis]|uniref:Uncharacterized protein n=1 Tax=Streptomyces lacrimifluminis TaxID=1500077 RepID=A0A917KYF3_9ACTN|nr:hypothetical protein GCM10012282_31660 [Streptomyces lacrimifluminis]